MSKDIMSADKVSVDVFVYKISVDKMPVNKISIDRIPMNEISVVKMSVKNV